MIRINQSKEPLFFNSKRDMALLRWHTPTPDEPIPVKAAATTPMASATILASLMKQTNYKDFDEFETFAFYPVIFPNRWKPEMFRQPDRFVYQMRSEILVHSEPAKALLLQQELSQQVAQRANRNGRTIPTVPEPPTDQQHGAESARDHLGADNIIRHMHPHTGSAYNAWARPKGGGDPYLGTGLNPAHVSGVELPVGEDRPIMACCGQPFDALDRTVVDTNGTSHRVYEWVAPPGCWSRLDTKQPYGLLVPYQVWFSTDDPARLWRRIITQQTNLLSETVTGTAFIDTSYYSGLDRQIRALVAELAPIVQRVHQQLLATAFAQPSGVALLLQGERDRLIQLVLLVQRYNAPQMGACHHDQTVGDDYLDERVFFVSTGKTEMQQGRLVVNVTIAGRKVPLVFRPTVEAFQKTVDALSGIISTGNLKPLLDVISLITEAETNQQWLNLAKSANDATIIKARQAPLSVGLPDILEIRISNLQSLYQAAEKLAAEMQNLLATLPVLTSDWIQLGATGSPPNSIVVAATKGTDIIRRMNIDDITEVRTDLEELLPLFETTTEEITNAITKDDTLRHHANKPEVQTWARASVVAGKIATAQFGPRELLLVDKRVVELYAAALAVAVATEVKKTSEVPQSVEPSPSPTQLAQFENDEENQRLASYMALEITIPKINVANYVQKPGQGIITRRTEYENLSCAYDSLFAALFMIPNQWLRNRIVQTTKVYSDCTAENASKLHAHITQVIEFLEGRRPEITICPIPEFWDDCMHTRPANRKLTKSDEPWKMINSLAQFYGISDNIQWVKFPHGDPNWIQNAININSNTKLLVVRPEPMAVVVQSLSNNQLVTYDVKPFLGNNSEFQLISCIIYTTGGGGHYEVAVRDPVSDEWFRFDTSGKSTPIGKNPSDIRTTILVGPYQPVHWFYVQTAMLSQFKPLSDRVELKEKTIRWRVEDWSTEKTKRSLHPLFGSEARSGYLFPPTSADVNEREASPSVQKMGVLQLLWYPVPNSEKVIVPGWKPYNSAADYINFVNEILIPKYLNPLIREGLIGVDYRLSDELLEKLRQDAAKAKMIYFNTADKYFQVPFWGQQATTNPGSQVVNFAGVEPGNFSLKVGRAWSNVLRQLMFYLLLTDIPSTAVTGEALRELTNDIALI